MAIDGPSSSTFLEEGGSNRMLQAPGRRDDTIRWREGKDDVDVRETV
jgi:hypothetical protein